MGHSFIFRPAIYIYIISVYTRGDTKREKEREREKRLALSVATGGEVQQLAVGSFSFYHRDMYFGDGHKAAAKRSMGVGGRRRKGTSDEMKGEALKCMCVCVVSFRLDLRHSRAKTVTNNQPTGKR